MTPGIYDAVITGNGIACTQGGSAFAAIHCDCEGEAVTAKIFLTEKAAGMARKSLSVCGFDIDKTHLSELSKPGLLAGNKVKLSFEEHAQYGLQANIFLGELTEKKVDALTKALRSAKGGDDKKKPGKSPKKVVEEATGGDDMPPLEDDGIPFSFIGPMLLCLASMAACAVC